MKTLCMYFELQKKLSQYGLAISQTLASIILKPELNNKLLTSLTSTWAFVSIKLCYRIVMGTSPSCFEAHAGLSDGDEEKRLHLNI